MEALGPAVVAAMVAAVALTWLAWRFVPDALGGLRSTAAKLQRHAAASWAAAPRNPVDPVAAFLLLVWGAAAVFNWPFMAQVLELWMPSPERWYVPYVGSVGAAALAVSAVVTGFRVAGAIFVFHRDGRGHPGEAPLRAAILAGLAALIALEGMGTYQRSRIALEAGVGQDAALAPSLVPALGWLGVVLGVCAPLFEIALGPRALLDALIPMALRVLGRVPAVVLWLAGGLLHLLVLPFPLPAQPTPAPLRAAAHLAERAARLRARVSALERGVADLDARHGAFSESFTAFEQQVRDYGEQEVVPPAHREEMRRVRLELLWQYRRLEAAGRRLLAEARALRQRWLALWREIGAVEAELARCAAELQRLAVGIHAGTAPQPSADAPAAQGAVAHVPDGGPVVQAGMPPASAEGGASAASTPGAPEDAAPATRSAAAQLASALDEVAQAQRTCASLKAVMHPLHPTLERIAELNQVLRLALRRQWQQTHVPLLAWTWLRLSWLWTRYRGLRAQLEGLQHDLSRAAGVAEALREQAGTVTSILAELTRQVEAFANAADQAPEPGRGEPQASPRSQARHLAGQLRHLARAARHWRARCRAHDEDVRRLTVHLHRVHAHLRHLHAASRDLAVRLQSGNHPQAVRDSGLELAEAVAAALASAEQLIARAGTVQREVAELARQRAHHHTTELGRLSLVLRFAWLRHRAAAVHPAEQAARGLRIVVAAGVAWAVVRIAAPLLPGRYLAIGQLATGVLLAAAVGVLLLAALDWAAIRAARGTGRAAA